MGGLCDLPYPEGDQDAAAAGAAAIIDGFNAPSYGQNTSHNSQIHIADLTVHLKECLNPHTTVNQEIIEPFQNKLKWRELYKYCYKADHEQILYEQMHIIRDGKIIIMEAQKVLNHQIKARMEFWETDPQSNKKIPWNYCWVNPQQEPYEYLRYNAE